MESSQNKCVIIVRIIKYGTAFIVFLISSIFIAVELSNETINLTIKDKDTQHIPSMKTPANISEFIVNTDKGYFLTSKEVYSKLYVSQAYVVNVEGFDALFFRKKILSIVTIDDSYSWPNKELQ